jgi:GNAT superfamily N-acetyltransferase
MEALMPDTKDAGARFLGNTLRPADRAFLVDFDTQPHLAHAASGELVSLIRSFGRFRADGFTALYDAIIFSMLQFEEGTEGRRALVLLTDGDDYKSKYSQGRCIRYGKDLGVPVYILGLGGIFNPRGGLPKIDLEGIVEGTGGRIFYIHDTSEIGRAYDRINAELRSQYLLAFSSDRELTQKELDSVPMLRGFPQEAVLRDGKRVLIRPFTAPDTGPLWQFFQSLPADVRRFAWDNIDDPAVVESWGRNINYSQALPLLAFDDHHLVADATLHHRRGGPLRLVGRIKWLIDPAYRGQGLGTILVNNFITIARHQGLRHLTCMLIADLEADAVTTLTGLGFTAYPVPGYGTDPDGADHDMVKLVLKL